MNGVEIFFLVVLLQVAVCILMFMLILSARKRRAWLRRRGSETSLADRRWEAESSGHLDDALLEEFMRTFFGYGTFDAKYWLLGMEEVGGESFKSIERRLREWRDAGKPKLMALEPKSNTQQSWGSLIRIVLAAEGESATTSTVRSYQRGKLGREHGETCLLELLPLPSPVPPEWPYGNYSELPHLKSRTLYTERTAPSRANVLHKLIAKHRPAVVVFYGMEYGDWWRSISGVEFDLDEEHGFGSAMADLTLYVSIPNPTNRGFTDEYFATIGEHITAKRRQLDA